MSLLPFFLYLVGPFLLKLILFRLLVARLSFPAFITALSISFFEMFSSFLVGAGIGSLLDSIGMYNKYSHQFLVFLIYLVFNCAFLSIEAVRKLPQLKKVLFLSLCALTYTLGFLAVAGFVVILK